MMINVAKKKILSILTGEEVKARFHNLNLSLSSGKIRLISSQTDKK